MELIKKIVTLFVCLNISLYGIPALAVVSTSEMESAAKSELSTAEMAAAVGGSFHSEILDTGLEQPVNGSYGQVKTMVAIGANCCGQFNYALESIDTSGNVLRTIASGTFSSANQARIISGPRQAGDFIFRVRMTWAGASAIASQDIVWPQFAQ